MLGLLLNWIPDKTIPTMGVNLRELRFNPEFVERLPLNQVIGVLAHEIAHCAYRHWARIKQSVIPHEIGNIAGDFVINQELIDDWGLTLPQGCLYDTQFAGMTLEQVAAKLMRDNPQSGKQGKGNGQGQGKGQTATDPEANPIKGDMDPQANGQGKGKGKDGDKDGQGTPSGVAEDGDGPEIDWGVEVERAFRVANSRGKLPSNIARRIQESKRTPEDWRTILMRFVQSVVVTDSSFCRPSRRGISQGYILPGPVKDGMRTIAIAVDTSGSIGDELLGQFWTQIQAIHSICKPERMIVLYCHAAVCRVDEFSESDTPVLGEYQSGGTAFQPVFDAIAERGDNPVCLIYLTDMQGDDPVEPSYPVLWCYPMESVERRHSVTWGEKVAMQG